MGCLVNTTTRPLCPWERDPVPIVQEAVWAQDRSGRVWKISPPPEFGPRIAQSVASRCTGYAMPTHTQDMYQYTVPCVWNIT